jgi:guanylate kinase
VKAPPRRGIPFVVAAPSGTGKTSVCRAVVARMPGIEFSVSHTTRLRREGEQDGIAYHFVGREDFRKLVEEDAFLEWAEYNGNQYGTSWRAIESQLAAGRDVLLEIEIQGARQVRARRPDARFVFLLPPSQEALEARLRGRGTDSPDQIAGRLALARRELAAVREFDYAVVNDDLERCVESVCEIVRAEREGRPDELRARFAPARALERLRADAD